MTKFNYDTEVQAICDWLLNSNEDLERITLAFSRLCELSDIRMKERGLPIPTISISGLNIHPPKIINGISCPVTLRFHRCRFFDILEIKECSFSGNLDFQDCTFRGGLTIENSSIKGNLLSSGETAIEKIVTISGINLKINWRCYGNADLRIQDCKILELNINLDGEYKGRIFFDGSSFELPFSLGLLGNISQAFLLSFERVRFLKPFFSDTQHWPNQVSFVETVFLDDVSIHQGTFQEYVDFSRAQFSGNVRFVGGVNFHNGVSFKGAQFLDNKQANRNFIVEFVVKSGGPFDFSMATINSSIELHSTILSEVSGFSGSIFRRGLSLSNVCFQKHADFKDVSVSHCLNIDSTSTFKSGVDFSKSVIGELNCQSAIFYGEVQLNKVNIEKVNFSQCKFRNEFIFSEAQVINFTANGAIFESITSFRDTIFKIAPRFHNAKLFQDTEFQGSQLDDVRSEGAEAAYRTLKFLMADLKNDGAEMYFAACELHSRRKKLGFKERWEWFFSWTYFIANDYGRSLVRPVACLGAVFLIFSLFYSYYPSVVLEPISINPRFYDPDIKIDHIKNSWLSNIRSDSCWRGFVCSRGVLFSFFNTLGPLRLVPAFDVLIPTNITLQLFSLMQNVLSTIFIFLFVIGVKRRFKTLS